MFRSEQYGGHFLPVFPGTRILVTQQLKQSQHDAFDPSPTIVLIFPQDTQEPIHGGLKIATFD